MNSLMNKSSRSRRKKKTKSVVADRSERRVVKLGTLDRSERRRKGKKTSELVGRRIKSTTNACERSGVDKKDKLKEKEQWSGEDLAKKMVASGVFNVNTITNSYQEIPNLKPPLTSCPVFQKNITKIRASDCPIPDDKLVKLTHAPENFICASKLNVQEFNRTVILTQVPDVSNAQSTEDFWRMIFHEEIFSIVIAVMPLEGSFTLQQMFPTLSGTFANHGKMFLNNKKVESAVAMTAYLLEVLPDGCSNSLMTTIYHLHNWKQKKGLDNVGELVSTMEKVLKTNENTVFMSMNGTGRAGTMLALFTAMLHVQKGKEVNMKEIMEKSRAERCGIVDNAEQYGTIYKALAIWFKSKSTDEDIQKKVNEFAPMIH